MQNSLRDKDKGRRPLGRWKMLAVCAMAALMIVGCFVLVNSTDSAEAATSGGSCGPNMTWTIDGDGNLEIDGSGDMNDFTPGSVRWGGNVVKTVKIDGTVASIGAYAFYGTDIKSVDIPVNAHTIGNYAFCNCSALKTVNMNTSTTTIGEGAFSDTALTTFKWPSSITTINDHMFDGCSNLTSFTIPVGVTTIGDYAFKGCVSLSSVTIPSSVTTIGEYSFCESGIATLAIPDNVTTVGDEAFTLCSKLTTVTIGTGLTSDILYVFNECPSLTAVNIDADNAVYTSQGGVVLSKDQTSLVFCPQGKSGAYTIPGTVTHIDSFAFYNCKWLTSVTIPDTVTTIGNCAFDDCVSLTSITIPDSVTLMGYGTFSECVKLSSVSIGTGLTSIPDFAFTGCASLTSITIPGTVTDIGNAAFESSGLRSITIPDSVTFIYDQAFTNCRSLASVTLPEGLTNIQNYAFSGCSKLTSISIPSTVTSIGEDAFNGCTSLTTANIPSGVTTIRSHTFSGCEKLSSITIPSTVTSIEDYAFLGCASLTSVIIPDNVTYVGTNAFKGCSKLVNVTIGVKVSTIGAGAFSDCPALKAFSVDSENVNYKSANGVLFQGNVLYQYPAAKVNDYYSITDTVTSIAAGAFSGCKNLKEVYIGDGVTSIGNNAFIDCTSLETVTIGESVNSIGTLGNVAYPFYGCTALKTFKVNFNNTTYAAVDGVLFNKAKTTLIQYPVAKADKSYVIPSSVTAIGNYAFNGCKSLESVTIPATVTSIGSNAFEECRNLAAITIPSSVTAIGVRAFSECIKLKSVAIPNSVSNLGDSAFAACTGLETVTIGTGVNDIEYSVFVGCISLKEINVYESNQHLASVDGVLYNADKTALIIYPAGRTDDTYTVPDTVSVIGTMAFFECHHLKSVVMHDGVILISPMAFYSCGSLNSVKLPSGGTVIGDFAFYNCPSIASIEIPDMVVSIGNYAFYGCSGLKTVTIGSGVTSIPDNAFIGCFSLEKIDVSESNVKYASVDGVLYNKEMTTLIQYPVAKAGESYVMPDSVSGVGTSAFMGTKNLRSVTVSQPVRNDINSVFAQCYGLREILVDAYNIRYASVDGVFYSRDLTAIYQYPMAKNDEAFTVSSSVSTIRDSAFSGNTSLKAINVDEANWRYGSVDGVLYTRDLTRLIQYPAGKSGESFTVSSAVSTIDEMAFYSANNLREINVESNSPLYSSVGGCLFDKKGETLIVCPAGLSSYKVTSDVKRIAEYAFTGDNLKDVTFESDTETVVVNGAFVNCMALDKLVIEDGAKVELNAGAVAYIGNDKHSIHVDASEEYAAVIPLVVFGGGDVSDGSSGSSMDMKTIALIGGGVLAAIVVIGAVVLLLRRRA